MPAAFAEGAFFDYEMTNIWQSGDCGWSWNRFAKQMPANDIKYGCDSIFVSKWNLLLCVFFFSEMHVKASGVFVGGGRISKRCLRHFVAPVISQRSVIDYSDRGIDCFTPISLWPYRWEITSTAGRMIGGKRDGPNLPSHYHSPVRKDWGGMGEGRDKRTEGEREKRGINQQGRRMRESIATVKRWEAGAKIVA